MNCLCFASVCNFVSVEDKRSGPSDALAQGCDIDTRNQDVRATYADVVKRTYVSSTPSQNTANKTSRNKIILSRAHSLERIQ
jgi:hypothetical protein